MSMKLSRGQNVISNEASLHPEALVKRRVILGGVAVGAMTRAKDEIISEANLNKSVMVSIER